MPITTQSGVLVKSHPVAFVALTKGEKRPRKERESFA